MTTLQKPGLQGRLRRRDGIAFAPTPGAGGPSRPAVSSAERIAPQRWPAGHRGRLIAAYGLTFSDSVLRLAQPLMIGLAIDGLLNSSFRGLLLFAVGYLLLTVVTAGGEMFRTRVFAAVQADALGRRFTSGEVAAAAAQIPADMMTRLERTLPDRLKQFVAIGGPPLLLCWYDATLVPFCLLLIVPFWLLRTACEPRTSACLRQQQRCLADLETADDMRHLTRHLDALQACRVQQSEIAAIRTALTELFVLGMLASALVHFVGRGVLPPSTGDMVAVTCYLLMFTSAACRRSAAESRRRTGDVLTL